VLVGLWMLYFCTTRDAWRTAPAILVASVVANFPLLPVMLKYHFVHDAYGLRRTMAEALWFSAPVEGWFKVSSVVWLWPKVLGDSKDDLFPGITAVALVIAALWFSRWRKPVEEQPRVAGWVLALLGVIAGLSAAAILVTLAIGAWRVEFGSLTLRTSDLNRPLKLLLLSGVPLLLIKTRVVAALSARGPLAFYAMATVALGLLCCGPVLRAGDSIILDPMPYRWLMLVPGFDQLRVPTRFWMLGTLCLGVAAAIAFARLAPATGARRRLAFALLSVSLLLDGWTNGIGMAAAPQQWPRVEPRADTSGGGRARPILELPLGPEWDAAGTYRAMRHRRPVMNGVSGYDPPHYEPLKSGLASYDPQLLLAIASLGELDVVVNGDADRDGAWKRYVQTVPGAMEIDTDGVRTLFRIPATTRPEVQLGPVVPIVGARANSQEASLAVDGRMETEWNDGRSQQPGQWLIADLGQVREVGGIAHALGEYARDFPRRLAIDTSVDGATWTPAWTGPTVVDAFIAATRAPIEARMPFAFEPRPARFVRLRQLDTEIHLWRVAELAVHGGISSR
jgi:hypothetical protein